MTSSNNTPERLKFLSRVVTKEVEHLEYAVQRVFTKPLAIEDIEQLDNNPELGLRIEAFVSRFCRLQDTLGDKLLPALLKSLGEPDRALLINLNKAEKYGWLGSAEQWFSLRQLRNQMIHEYIEEAKTLFDALLTAYDNVEVLKAFSDKLLQQTSSLQ